MRDSMSAPEMPAKEVSPEFGFRDASPSVAAAALAALKTGGGSDGRRGRTATTRRSPAKAAQAEPAAVAAPDIASAPVETITDGDEQARRRRRRRGGRGRGRSRREDEETPAATGSEEVGWQEFDDLSQVDGADSEREYTFEEADAATLAELGLPPQEVPAADAPSEEKPKRRSTRIPKAEAGGEPATEEKPKRRSTRTPKAEGDAPSAEKPKRRSTRAPTVDESADAAPEEKPKRRSTRTPKADDAPSVEGGEGEPQGIWGRFRTARKPRSGSTG